VQSRANNEYNINLIAIMDDHAGRKSTYGQEMGNNEFSWSGLTVRILLEHEAVTSNEQPHYNSLNHVSATTPFGSVRFDIKIYNSVS